MECFAERDSYSASLISKINYVSRFCPRQSGNNFKSGCVIQTEASNYMVISSLSPRYPCMVRVCTEGVTEATADKGSARTPEPQNRQSMTQWEGASVNSLKKICHSGKRKDFLMKICTKLEVSCTRAVSLMLLTLQQMLIKNLKSWCEDWNCHLPWVVCLLTYSFLQGTAGVLVLFACQLITYAMTHPDYGMGKRFLASNSSSH